MSVDKILSPFPLFMWCSLIIIPLLWPFAPAFEGRIIPVVENIQISNVEVRDGGVLFYVRFNKLRQCEFKGLTWYKDNQRLVLQFEPSASESYISRPVGDQFTGPWKVLGVDSLKGTTAIAVHRCHPLWLTYTPFWP